MGFNFNGISTANKQAEFNESLRRAGNDGNMKFKLEEAQKQGGIALMFFYYFLDRLVHNLDDKPVENPSPIIEGMMNAKTIDPLSGLKAIRNFNNEYGYDDAEAIWHVIEVLQKATDAKK